MANQVNVSTTTNTVTITPQNTTNVSVGASNTSVTVNQGSTSVVQVDSQGPQGPRGTTGTQGPQGDPGTFQNTGSLLLTASYSNPDLTFTKGDGSTFDVGISTTVPTLDQVLTQGKQSDVPNIILTSTTPFNLTNLNENVVSNSVIVHLSLNGLIGKREISSYVWGDGLTDNFIARSTSSNYTAQTIGAFNSNLELVSNLNLKFITDTTRTNSGLQIGGASPGTGTTFIGQNAITSSIISASTEIIGDTKRDSFTRGFFRTSDGIDNKASYFVTPEISTATGYKHDNFGVSPSISSSDYYQLVIPSDDMSSPVSLDISGILKVQGSITPSSPGIKIDVYTASITPNSLINDPLTFNRAFIGDTINLNSTLTTQSIHVTQSFDISSLSPNSVLAVALSNASLLTAVTTSPMVSISFKISRNYKV